jgi:hypothetical protein
MPKCQTIKVVFSEPKNIEIECGKPATIYSGGTHLCFTCARTAANLGDVLAPTVQRRFRQIERVVCALPS